MLKCYSTVAGAMAKNILWKSGRGPSRKGFTMNPNELLLEEKTIAIEGYGEKTVTEILKSAELMKAVGLETVELDKVLKTSGVEFADTALSVTYGGCLNQCSYCFYGACMGRFHHVTCEEFGKPKMVHDMLIKLDDELAKKRKKPKSIFITFSGDGFP